MIYVLPFFLIFGGLAAVVAIVMTSDNPPVHEPDLPPMPGSTGYKLVDAMLGELKKASQSSGIPLGLIIGWIAKESGGKLAEVTSLDERGVFQLMPAESAALGLDHQRLSTDLTYSINGGLARIGQIMGEVSALGVAPRGSSYFWLLCKLVHTMGGGDTKTLVRGAQAANQAGSWQALEQYAMSGQAKTKHSPNKWFPFIDKIYRLGYPFGFGDEAPTSVVGGVAFNDIPDPLALLRRRR